MLKATRPSPGETLVGDVWILSVDAYEAWDGAPVSDATLTVEVTDPRLAVTSPAPVVSSTVSGRWTLDVPITAAGRWTCTVVASGTTSGTVAASTCGITVASTTPTVAELQAYLGIDGEIHEDTELAEVLAAETTAQSRMCRVTGGVYQADLRAALMRRCAVALAKKALPLSMVGLDSEAGAARMPMWDAEIRRLEAPHRRLVCG